MRTRWPWPWAPDSKDGCGSCWASIRDPEWVWPTPIPHVIDWEKILKMRPRSTCPRIRRTVVPKPKFIKFNVLCRIGSWLFWKNAVQLRSTTLCPYLTVLFKWRVSNGRRFIYHKIHNKIHNIHNIQKYLQH